MKSAIIIFFILIFSTISHANDLSKKITETASNYISNLIPGEGTTEVSIDLRENYKPDFSILGVREVKKKIMEIFLHSFLYSVLNKIIKRDMLEI